MKQLTMNEAKAKMQELVNELNWLEVLLDKGVAERLEIYIEPTPKSLIPMLQREFAKRESELKYLKEELSKQEDTVRCISIYTPEV